MRTNPSNQANSEMETILQRAAKGDREAMARIVSEYYAPVYGFCVRRLGADLGQDAAQETFVTAQRGIKRFDGRSTLSTWLFGIANNHCREQSRKRKREITFEDSFDIAGNEQVEAGAVNREFLRNALLKLSPEHREVVVLHEIEELTYEEAAAVLGVPVGTVKSRLNAAFGNLRRSMGATQ